MTITSSTFSTGPAQIDSRIWVTETHTDAVVGPLLYAYLAANSTNATATMNARVTQIKEMLAQNEFEFWIVQDTPIVTITPLHHQNATEFATRLVARFHASEKLERGRLCAWVLNRIDGGIYTDTQVHNAFGYSAGQWTTYKAAMTTLRTQFNAIMAAARD